MNRLAAPLFVLVVIAVAALAQPPPRGGGQGMRSGFAPPPFPGDSTAGERDSLMDEVMKSIAGKEQMPAESVFKDIQILKGRVAGDVPRVMNYGFGRSIGASCYHFHAKNDWAKDEKKQKRIAREMYKMVLAINTDYISKIEGLGDAPPGAQPERGPTVNCSTCHRGSIHAGGGGGRGGPGGPRPGGPR